LVGEFEERLRVLGGRPGAVVASRATVGLAAGLKALGLPAGSEVLMPVMLCANVVHAVRGAGLRPVFVDMEVGEFGFGMDLAKAEKVIAEHRDVKVLLVVPLFGGGVDVEGTTGLAKRHGLVIVEDRAQCALGVGNGGVSVDSKMVVHSFGAGKISDAGGGAVVLSDDLGLLERVRRELDGKRDLSETAARITRSVEGLEEEIAGRRRVAEGYRESLRMEGVEHPGGETPLWKYSVLLRDRAERDRVTRRLLERGVAATNLYMPLSRWFGGYEDSGRGEFAVGWEVWERIINLPLWSFRDGLVEDVSSAFEGGAR
jgi:dTDP-4-amino-4,6-dideoxygalactose transaminase